MYHICPADGQTHFRDGESRDDWRREAAIPLNVQELFGQLLAPVGRRVTAVQESCQACRRDGLLDLRETGDDEACLVGERKSVEGLLQKLALDLRGQLRGDFYWALEAALKGRLLDRLGEVGLIGRDPDPAAGQAPFQIGNNAAVRCFDEAD